MTTTTETPTADEQSNPDSISIGDAFREYFDDEVADDDKPKAFPEVQRFARWIGEDQRVDKVIASEVAQFSETYRSNASKAQKDQARHIKGFLNFLKKRQYTTDSLASHIRVRPRSNAGQRAPVARPKVTEDNRLTQAGFDEYKRMLEELYADRPKAQDDVARAAASGDVRENAPLDAARDRHGYIEGEIRRIEGIIDSAVVISEDEQRARAGEGVLIGNTVSVLKIGEHYVYKGEHVVPEFDADKQRPTKYQIVSSHEANPLQSKISNVSPVGVELMGKKTGDKIKVKTPKEHLVALKNGNKSVPVIASYEILSIA